MTRSRLPLAPLRAPLLGLCLAALISACATPLPESNVDTSMYPDQQPPTGGTTAGTNPGAVGALELGHIGDRVAVVGRELVIQLTAMVPPDSMSPIAFNIRSRLPNGAYFDKQRGFFTWRPTQADVGQSTLLTFEVSDGVNKDQETIAVTVQAEGAAMNLPPTVSPISDQALQVGQPWTLQLQASDPNGDPLTYSVTGAAPQGLMLSPNAGRLAWTPTPADAGTHQLTLIVSDGMLTAQLTLRLVVRAPGDTTNSNTPPVFNRMGNVSAVVGQPVSFQVSAVDDNPASLIFAMERGPQGASFSAADRRFSWTPTAEFANRSVEVVFSVTDGMFKSYLPVGVQVMDVPVTTEPCPYDAYIDGQTHNINTDSPLNGLILCEEGAVDIYRFTLYSAMRLEAAVSFDGRFDIDIELYDGAHSRVASSNAAGTSSEELSELLEEGTYTLEVKLYSGRAAEYALSLTTSAAPLGSTCDPDEYDDGSRGAPNDSAASASLISFQTYSGLTSCGDEDWFSVSGSSRRPVVVYVRSDDPFSYVMAEQYSDSIDVSTEEMPDGVDGCYDLSGVRRNYCRRAEIRAPYDGYVDFRVVLTLEDGEYDILVRSGEEVSARCTEDDECGVGFECRDNLDYDYFTYNTCSKDCNSFFECGGAHRECITNSSSFLTGSCFQECNSSADCRDGFTCESKQSAGGYSTSVCVPF